MPAGRLESLACFTEQAVHCDELGSPFTAGLCRLLAGRIDRGSGFGRRIIDWPGDAVEDRLALRACGALHALARSGDEPGLAAVYPPAAFSGEAVWPAIAGALTRHDAFLTSRLDGPPQTNEVARSAIILGGCLAIAEETRLPLELLEIGASAGLNLVFDRYGYELGNGRRWGPPDPPLVIDCAWRGTAPPLSAPLAVASRRACDRNPLDPASPTDAAHLAAYIWPDQSGRLARLDAALGIAADARITIEKADAADWAERELARPPTPGFARVLLHTIVWSYLEARTMARIEAALEAAGQRATAASPIAHLGVQPDGGSPGALVHLTVWPGGKRRNIGRADFHGRWVEWDYRTATRPTAAPATPPMR